MKKWVIRIAGVIIIIGAFFYLITYPTQAGDAIQDGIESVGNALNSFRIFFESLAD